MSTVALLTYKMSILTPSLLSLSLPYGYDYRYGYQDRDLFVISITMLTAMTIAMTVLPSLRLSP